MVLISILVHVDVSRVDVSSSSTGLNVLNECGVEIKSDDEITVRNVETFLGDRCGEETINGTFPETRHSKNLIAEGLIQIASISTSGAD